MLEFQKVLIQAAGNFHKPEYKSQEEWKLDLNYFDSGKRATGVLQVKCHTHKKKGQDEENSNRAYNVLLLLYCKIAGNPAEGAC